MAVANAAVAEKTAPVSPAELVARARAMQPVLRERAERAEAERHVPRETVAEFKKAGLIRMTQPRRFAGAAMGWDTLCEVAQTLAAADGAQAWIQAIMADHAVILGTWDDRAQNDVWGADPDAAMSASLDPKGIAKPCDGGFMFSGTFAFSSGVDHADWVICGGFVVEDDKRSGPHFFLLPRADIRIVDDWFTAGLEGTGSKTFEVAEVFVPAHRMLDGPSARAGRAVGANLDDAPVYRLPRGGLTPTVFAALSVGMAQGLLAEWLKYTASRVSRDGAMGGHPASHIVAGEASAKIASAEALYLTTIRDAMRRVGEGETLSDSYILQAKRNASWAARVALEAGTLLFNNGGGRAIFTANAMQRQYRNLVAAAAHYSIQWETNAMACGKDLIASAG